jgi:hypothetical protein
MTAIFVFLALWMGLLGVMAGDPFEQRPSSPPTASSTVEPITTRVTLADLMPLEEAEVRDLVFEFGGVEEMVPVAHCESRYDPTAVNADSGARGTWQFMRPTWRYVREHVPEIGPYDNAYDPYLSTMAAVWLWENDGPHHWECYR